MHTASNANQKEKYEADLKKEIKKLQVSGVDMPQPEKQTPFGWFIFVAVERPTQDMVDIE